MIGSVRRVTGSRRTPDRVDVACQVAKALFAARTFADARLRYSALDNAITAHAVAAAEMN